MSSDEKHVIDLKSHTAIYLFLVKDVLREVADKDSAAGLWLKLKSLFYVEIS